MSTMFSTENEPRVLGAPGGAAALAEFAKPFREQARDMHKHLKAGDISPAARKSLEAVTALSLMVLQVLEVGREKRETIERRLDALESAQREGKGGSS